MRSKGSAEAGGAAIAPAARLGAAVRARRRALGLTQAQLADLAGVGLAFLYDLERGKPSARLDKVLDVLVVLGLSLRVEPGREPIAVDDRLGPKGGP